MSNSLINNKLLLVFASLLLFQFLLKDVRAEQTEQYYIDRLDQLFKNHLAHIAAPGFSVAVVKNGKVIMAKGYGKRIIKQAKPMTEDTMLSIGSLTKSFTAMAILQLQEKGLLNIDDPVIKYLPWFRSSDKAKSDTITLRMLLNNSSGLSPSFTNLSRNLSQNADALENGVRAMSSYEIKRKPGESFEYLNEGWNTLGLIVEKTTGMSWEQYLQKNILTPLQMTHSSADRSVLENMDVATGHYSGITPVPASMIHIQGSLPAGSGFFSTADDLSRYLMALVNGGKWDGKRLLSSESMSELWTPTVSLTGLSYEMGGDGKPSHYAMGWIVSEFDGEPYISHGGETTTSSSEAMIDPVHKSAVVILYNTGSLDFYTNESAIYLTYNALRILKGKSLSQLAVPREKDPLLNDYIPAGKDFERYYGIYLSDSGRRMRIESGGSEGLKMYLQEGIYPSDYDVDFINDTSFAMRNFAKIQQGYFNYNEDGTVVSINWEGEVFRKKQDIDLQKFTKHQSSDAHFSFALPSGWAVSFQKNGFEASGGDELSMKGQVTRLGFEDWVQKSIGGSKKPDNLQPLSALKNGYIFQGRLVKDTEYGRKIILLYTGTQEFKYGFIFSVPMGQLTHEIIETLNPFLDSIDLR